MLKPLAQCLVHPEEFLPLLELRKRIKNSGAGPTMGGSPDESIRFCYHMLRLVSRSFATVIEELGDELRLPVAIFYLVLRGLDTIEDDTSIPLGPRVEQMRAFCSNLRTRGWTFGGAGVAAEKELLEKFHHVGDVFRGLHPRYRAVIQDIANRMCEGMVEFAEREVSTIEDYNLYCHYVAGLVGHGLSKLFAAAGLESADFAGEEVLRLSNLMGLFLQKANIIRDVREDDDEKRYFWPKEVWSVYGSSIHALCDPANRGAAVACLNHLVTDALELAPSCLEYMALLKDPQNFNFCVIPQVMAIATLHEVFNNPRVFDGVIKIRRGTTARLMQQTRSIADCRAWFRTFALSILGKVSDADPSAARTREAALRIVEVTEGAEVRSLASPWVTMAPVLGVAAIGAGIFISRSG
eukprot:TRINITY_DN7121_c0_g1_i4.p2 TRINITY_DN7121_c0_g1~~TRINITY_DN7121_c0_g1_i4.p2  ORF type:complete len:410 (+),score=203.98 TRINITY_DN7121_c0_g1_i4:92-1321(+)